MKIEYDFKWDASYIYPGMIFITTDPESQLLYVAQVDDNQYLLINLLTGVALDAEPSTAEELVNIAELRHYSIASDESYFHVYNAGTVGLKSNHQNNVEYNDVNNSVDDD